jgi:hypothetical protein
MTMPHHDTDPLAALVADLRPVRPMRFAEGMVLVTAAGAATLGFVALILGWRADVLAGQFRALWLLANGLFLVLAIAAGSAAVAMASPQVGQSRNSWKWAGTTAALLPLTAVILLASRAQALPPEWMSATDRHCLTMGLGLGMLTAAVLTTWLRRGAPASPNRAGLLVGMASGSVGILAFAFNCPSDSLYHIGIWHSATIAAGAILGRLVVPTLIRW